MSGNSTEGPAITLWRRKYEVPDEAAQVALDNIVTVADWISGEGVHCDQYERHLVIDGRHHAAIGDWVVRHEAPESSFTVLHREAFAARYEPVTATEGQDSDAEEGDRKMTETTETATVYHPDPWINEGIIADAIEAERFDLVAGYPPRRWRCICGAEHSRGHFGAIGIHRCLACGYVGAEGVMFGSTPVQVTGGQDSDKGDHQ